MSLFCWEHNFVVRISLAKKFYIDSWAQILVLLVLYCESYIVLCPEFICLIARRTLCNDRKLHTMKELKVVD